MPRTINFQKQAFAELDKLGLVDFKYYPKVRAPQNFGEIKETPEGVYCLRNGKIMIEEKRVRKFEKV